MPESHRRCSPSGPGGIPARTSTPRDVHDSKTPIDAAARPPNSRRWTTDELAMLRRVAWTMTAAQIGLLLGRTALAVRTKAAHERIRLKIADDTSSSHGSVGT